MCSVHRECTQSFHVFVTTVTGFANRTLNIYMYFVDSTAYPTAPMFLWQGWRHDCRGGDTTDRGGDTTGGVETRLSGVETRLQGWRHDCRGGDTTAGVETRL